MVQDMVKDAHWVRRINDVIIPKMKKQDNVHRMCVKYVENLEDLNSVLSHQKEQKCRCLSVILQSKHAWIAHNEPEYRDIMERAVFPCPHTEVYETCWLQEKIIFYKGGVAAFDTQHIRVRYQDIVSLMENGRYRNAAALFWYTISSIGEKVTVKHPTLHHNDRTCDCERYFTEAPKAKTVSKMFQLENIISSALKHKTIHDDFKEKCWTQRTISKFNKYVKRYSLIS
jgi:hypothetical protein